MSGLRLGLQAAVDFDAAGQVQVAVDLAFAVAHLEGECVVDPIAHFVFGEVAIGDGWGEGEGGGVELREGDVEVDGGGVAGPHFGELMALAKGVGTGEIDAQVVAEHEADVGVENGLAGARADAEDDFGGGFEEVERAAVGVGGLDADDLRAGVAVAVIDVGDAGDEFGGLRGGGGLGRRVFGAGEAEELRVFFDHVCQVLGNYEFSFSELADLAVVEPHGTVADGFDVANGVRDEEDRDAFGAEFVHLSHAALAEVDVTDGEGFVDEEDLGIDMDGHGEGEADGHAAGVGFDGLVDEVSDFGEGFNFGVAGVDLGGAEAEDGGVEIDVFATGEFGVEA